MTMINRREKGSGSIYKCGRIYYIKYVDSNGKAYQESSSSQFKSDAERLLQDRLKNPIEKKYTLNDIIGLFLSDYEMRGRKNIRKVQSNLKAVMRVLGHRKVIDIKEETIQWYQKHRLQEGVSQATVNRECQLLGQSLNSVAYPK